MIQLHALFLAASMGLLSRIQREDVHAFKDIFRPLLELFIGAKLSQHGQVISKGVTIGVA